MNVNIQILTNIMDSFIFAHLSYPLKKLNRINKCYFLKFHLTLNSKIVFDVDERFPTPH